MTFIKIRILWCIAQIYKIIYYFFYYTAYTAKCILHVGIYTYTLNLPYGLLYLKIMRVYTKTRNI